MEGGLDFFGLQQGGAGFFCLRQGGGVFLDAVTYKPLAPQPVNFEPSLTILQLYTFATNVN